MIKSSRSRLSAELKAKAGDTDRDLDYSGYHRKQIKGNNNYYNTALNKKNDKHYKWERLWAVPQQWDHILYKFQKRPNYAKLNKITTNTPSLGTQFDIAHWNRALRAQPID